MAVPWHRIFGMALTQYFAGTAWQVDVEVDLSLQQQRLDLVVLRRQGVSALPVRPDGFGTPADYNLLTFKALKDALDAWALKELSAHVHIMDSAVTAASHVPRYQAKPWTVGGAAPFSHQPLGSLQGGRG